MLPSLPRGWFLTRRPPSPGAAGCSRPAQRPLSSPLPDQVVLDSCKIMGVWRSHTGVHRDPQAGVGAVECRLQEHLLPLASVLGPRVPHRRGHGQLEERHGHPVGSALPRLLRPRNKLSCRRAVHGAGELQLGHPVPHGEVAGGAPRPAADGVGVAEGAAAFLGGRMRRRRPSLGISLGTRHVKRMRKWRWDYSLSAFGGLVSFMSVTVFCDISRWLRTMK